MTAPKKKTRPKVHIDLPFDEAVERFIQVDPKEVEDRVKQADREAEEAKKYVEERTDSIRRGARRTKHRFRL